MSTTVTPRTPQGSPVALGIPDSQDYPRLVFTAPYFEQVPLAEIIEPSVLEAVEGMLPSLVPPYVQNAAEAAVQQLAVLLTGSTMSGPLYLAPLMPTQPSQAASMAYVDAMVATAGVPEVPPVPAGQIWARTTGQWVPISEQEGTFLPLAGGTMQGQINMSGYAINNLAALPNMPNGAAPASWVLQQIASVSLYQGTWNMDTYVPDLTLPQYHVNGYTWIAITTSTSGVVIGPAIPGLQGQTVFNGDTIIWSNIQGQFNRIHSGGLSLAEAQALFLPFTGGTMTGPLIAFENPTEAMEVATMGWVESLLPSGGVIPPPPTDGQVYGRNGLTSSWIPVLPLAGGVMTGPITLSGNVTNGLQAVPLQQVNGILQAGYLPLAGGTMQGLMVLSGNATANLNPVPLQQLNSVMSSFIPLSGGTLTGALVLAGNAVAALNPVPLQQLTSTLAGYVSTSSLAAQLAGYLPLAGGTITGSLVVNGNSAVGGSLLANNGIYPNNNAVPDFWIGRIAPNRILNWGANWYDAWNETTGTRNIVSAGNVIMALDASGNMTITGNMACGLITAANTNFSIGSIGGVAFSGAGNVSNVGQINAAIFAASQLFSGPNCTFSVGTIGLATFPGSGSGIAMAPPGDDQGSVGVPGQAWFQVAAYNFAQQSDPRSKKDMAPAPAGALSKVLAIPVKNFRWLSEAETAPLHTGFDATDVQAALGDAPAVSVGTDEAKTLSLNTMEVIAWLWQAVQELSAQVTAMKPA